MIINNYTVYFGHTIILSQKLGFKSIEYIMSEINFKRRKCTVIFDYVILKKAIPLVWVNMLNEEMLNNYTRKENISSIPNLCVAKKR